MSFLSGKKTHIIAIVIVLLNLAVALNWISPAHLVQINVILAGLGLSALRAGVAKVTPTATVVAQTQASV